MRRYRREVLAVIPCFGCGKPTPRMNVPPASRRTWCDACIWVAGDFHAIERAARLLERYGAPDALAPIAAGLENIRQQLSASGTVVTPIALEAKRRAREKERQRRYYDIRAELLESIVDDDDDDARWWIDDFASLASEADDESDGPELRAKFHTFVNADRARIASFCTCGHALPHPEDRGCVGRGCGCGSPGRARRAAAEAARARSYSLDDLRAAWPQLPTD